VMLAGMAVVGDPAELGLAIAGSGFDELLVNVRG